MKFDLNFATGFTINVDNNLSEDEQQELFDRIQRETNAALSMVAYKYGLGVGDVEFQIEEVEE